MHWIAKILFGWMTMDFVIDRLKKGIDQTTSLSSGNESPNIKISDFTEQDLHLQLLIRKMEKFMRKHQKYIDLLIEDADRRPDKGEMVEVLYLNAELSQDFEPIFKQAELLSQDLHKYVKIEVLQRDTPISENAVLDIQVKKCENTIIDPASKQASAHSTQLDPAQDPNYDAAKQQKEKSVGCWRIFLRFLLFIFFCGLVNSCSKYLN